MLGEHDPRTELGVVVVHAELEERQRGAVPQTQAEPGRLSVQAQEGQPQQIGVGCPPRGVGVEGGRRGRGQDRRSGRELPLPGLDPEPFGEQRGEILLAVLHLEDNLARVVHAVLQPLEPVSTVLGKTPAELLDVAGHVDEGRVAHAAHVQGGTGPFGSEADRDDVRVGGGDGGEIDHAQPQREQPLGELGRGLGVGRHRAVKRGLLVGRRPDTEGTGEDRQDGNQLAAALHGDQPHRPRHTEGPRPRPQPSRSDEGRSARRHRQVVPAIDELRREPLQNPAAQRASDHRSDLLGPCNISAPRWALRRAAGYWRRPSRTSDRPRHGLAARFAAGTLALVAGLVLAGCTVAGQASADPADTSAGVAAAQGATSTTFGTLVSQNDHTADEVKAEAPAAMVELSWARAEPTSGGFDLGYLQSMRAQAEALHAAGRPMALGLGLHDTPDWVLALPDARFVDQFGNLSAEANLVFDQAARDAAEAYFAKVAAQLDLSTFDAIRITSGGLPEVLYPGGGRYWAFDVNAQGGPGRPPSLPPNPLPGWRPGTSGPDAAQIGSWADWYVGALDNVVTWQIDALGRLGFRARYQIVTPGVGVQPGGYDQAVGAGLPPGLLGAGVAWQRFYTLLPRRPDIVAYVSSVADGSGNDDSCGPGDDAVPVDDAATTSWSATRWISSLARREGFAVAGENPGWHQSGALDARYVDTSGKGMMTAAVRQARSCGLSAFYWAHDAQLWDGTVPFDLYARLIGSK